RVRPNSIMTNQKGEKNMIGYMTVAKELNKIKLIEKDELKQKLLNNKKQDMIGSLIGLSSKLDKKISLDYKVKIKEEFGGDLNLKNRIQFNHPYVFQFIKSIKHFFN
ncbi:MAG: hypothetical protein ACRCZ9_00310, partial [Fusobacteriaceae bacterium]